MVTDMNVTWTATLTFVEKTEGADTHENKFSATFVKALEFTGD